MRRHQFYTLLGLWGAVALSSPLSGSFNAVPATGFEGVLVEGVRREGEFTEVPVEGFAGSLEAGALQITGSFTAVDVSAFDGTMVEGTAADHMAGSFTQVDVTSFAAALVPGAVQIEGAFDAVDVTGFTAALVPGALQIEGAFDAVDVTGFAATFSEGLGAGKNVMLVVGDPNTLSSSDTALQSLLEGTLGHTVVVKDDNVVDPDLTGIDLVILSGSAAEGALDDSEAYWIAAEIPLLCLEWTFTDNLLLGTATTAPGQTQVDIDDPTHPAAGGVSGDNVTVFGEGATISLITSANIPGGGHVVVSSAPSALAAWMLVFEPGSELSDESAAAGLRAFLGVQENIHLLNETGLTLLASLVEWMLLPANLFTADFSSVDVTGFEGEFQLGAVQMVGAFTPIDATGFEGSFQAGGVQIAGTFTGIDATGFEGSFQAGAVQMLGSFTQVSVTGLSGSLEQGASLVLFADDFSGDNDDPWNPEKWEDIDGTGADWSIDIQDNRGRLITDDGSYARCWAKAIMAPAGDFIATGTLEWTTPSAEQYTVLAVRVSGEMTGEMPDTGYAFELAPGWGEITTYRFVSGVETELNTEEFNFTTGLYLWEIVAEGSTIELRLWHVLDERPSTPTIAIEDSQVAQGVFAVSQTNGADGTPRHVELDYVLVAQLEGEDEEEIDFDAEITANDDVQDFVDTYGPGAKFLLKAGTYTGQTVTPEDGQWFIAEEGVVFDGDGEDHAFIGGDTEDVVIRGIKFTGYDPPAQYGVVHGQTGSGFPITDGWVIEFCEFEDNGGVAIRTGDRMKVRYNKIIRQEQLGIGGHGTDLLIEGNEIAFCNFNQDYEWGWEAGGSKFVFTVNAVIRGNYFHDNEGPGIWCDIDNYNALIEENIVEDNLAPGIFYEISCVATIRNNEVRRNGSGHTGWLWGAGIQIANSRDVEVYGNLLEHNRNGICATLQERSGEGPFTTCGSIQTVDDIYIHDNTIVQDTGVLVGIARDWNFENNSLYSTFQAEGNTYITDRDPDEGGCFAIWEYNPSWEDWQEEEDFDLTGSFGPPET